MREVGEGRSGVQRCVGDKVSPERSAHRTSPHFFFFWGGEERFMVDVDRLCVAKSVWWARILAKSTGVVRAQSVDENKMSLFRTKRHEK